jgi:hypothetical protein
MKDHKKILQLIENVDPNDTAALDEIDALVEVYVLQITFGRDESGCRVTKEGWKVQEPAKYTRSLDAQEGIDVNHWELRVWQIGKEFSAWMGSPWSDEKGRITINSENRFPTEPLARLHAKIQAIAYERA